MEPIRQVHTRHVERHAAEAVAQRLGRRADEAVIGSTRDKSGSVVLHLNSGGNALAAQSRLLALGYRVESTDYDPFAAGHYGVQLRVSPGVPLDATWCAGSRTAPASLCRDLDVFYANPRGRCAHCGRDMQILGDGTLRNHKADTGTPIG